MSSAGEPSVVVVETSLKPAEPEVVSVTATVAVTSASRWFGGHSVPGVAEQVTTGGVASRFTVTLCVDVPPAEVAVPGKGCTGGMPGTSGGVAAHARAVARFAVG